MNRITMFPRVINDTIYLFAKVDGDKEFHVRARFADESFVNLNTPTSDLFSEFRTSPASRLVRDGECEESCCPSLFAEITVGKDLVRWSAFQYSYGGLEKDESYWASIIYEFELSEYEATAIHALSEFAALTEHLSGSIHKPPQ